MDNLDNLDDWLNSLEMDNTENNSLSPTSAPSLSSEESAIARTPSDPFSEDDLLSILADNGYSVTPEADAEEITGEGEGEWEEEDSNDNSEESPNEARDLDAEEDNDFTLILQSGDIVPVDMDRLNQVAPDSAIGPEEYSWDVVSSRTETVPVTIGDQHADVPVIHEESAPDVPDFAPLITPNSPTLTMDDSTSRFSGTEWYNEIQKQRVILAGLGGIGSWTALQLARMNLAALFLYDDDIVERANMSGQFYANGDIGESKASAVFRTITGYTNSTHIYAIPQRFTADTEAGDVMICGFDNMAARRLFFDKWGKHVAEKPIGERKKCLFLDGRLSIDCLQVFCISGYDTYNINRYYDYFLFSDSDADATVCSMKQTTYLACMIGSFIVNLFTNWVANSLSPVIPYDLPFFTEYDSQNMIFKTEN